MNKSFKYLFYCLSLLLIITAINSIVPPKENKSIFTQPINHQLHKISGGVMLSENEIVFVDKKWTRSTGKSYSNIKYYQIEEKILKNLTEESTTQSDYSPIYSKSFNNTIFFLRSTKGRTHLYYLKINEEKPTPKQLTNFPIDISNIKISGNTLVFSAEMYYNCTTMECTAEINEKVDKRGPNTYMEYTKLMVRHWDHWYIEGKADHPFYQKLTEKGEDIELDGTPIDMLSNKAACSPPIENGAESFSISEDEKYIAFVVHLKDEKMSYNTKWDIYLYNTEKKTSTIITKNEKGRCQIPKFSSARNQLLAYFCMPRYGLESDQLHLRVYNISANKVILEKNTEKYLQFPSDFEWVDEEKLIFYLISIEQGHSRIYLYNHTKTKSAFTRISNDDNAYSSILYHTSSTIYVSYSSWLFPEVIGKLTKVNKKWTSSIIVNLNEEELKKYELPLPVSFEYNCTLNSTCQGWIMKPINYQKGKKYPLAFLIHGGPEGAWDPAWSFRWNPQNWANRGYAVVMINPHGSSGCGIDFQDAVRYNWGGSPFQDLMIGWEYVKATYSDWIDMNRVGGCGASYGGFMINWIQGHNQDKKFKCLVTHDGVFSTITMFYATEEMWFPMSEYCPHDQWGCTPYNKTMRKGYEDFNPEYFVQNWNTPHLIIHGSMDFRIPITEGVSAFAALKMRKVPSRFIHFPDENHWVLKPENSIKWYEEVLGWLDKYTSE